MIIKTEKDLIALCLQLLGDSRSSLSPQESEVASTVTAGNFSEEAIKRVRADILRGDDPLGNWFSSVRSSVERRKIGAVYTPAPIVNAMLGWLAEQTQPARIVDPGAGSGRFVVAAGARFPGAALIAVEMDPVAALTLRANLTVTNYIGRTRVIVDDFRNLDLPPVDGITAFIGNPPYVRHHDIDSAWKKWYSESYLRFGIKASALAGLHLHFFLKARLLAKEDDIGAFITSSEWLDVNYGSAMRKFFVDELGGQALNVLEPGVAAFPGTCTTAAIACFRVGQKQPSIRVRSVEGLEDMNRLSGGNEVLCSVLENQSKWSKIVRPGTGAGSEEMELGELFRVHRGQVTGANKVWIADANTLLPDKVLFPAITRARELIAAGNALHGATHLKRVIDIPVDYKLFSGTDVAQIETFLAWAHAEGASETYIATHRKAWWAVGLREPAPILCTYMARRPPQFTLNLCGARHINIAHGLYPRKPISPEVLNQIVLWLNGNVCESGGRTYSGGLTKFEPKEIERIKIPSIERFMNGQIATNMDQRGTAG